MRYLLPILFLTTISSGQVINLKMDFQTNSVMQLDRAEDGTIWGITSSNIDRLPTIAGVWAVRSTDEGKSWDTSCVTADWWRWGVDVCAVSAQTAWVVTMREDTVELRQTTNGGKSWAVIRPEAVGLDRPVNVHFFDAKHGTVLGTQGRRIERKWVVARTTDGGATWTQSLPMLAEPPTESLADLNDRSVSWNDDHLYVAMNSGRILQSTDRGVSWRFLVCPLRPITGLIVQTADAASKGASTLRVYSTGSNGVVQSMETTTGDQWTNVAVPPTLHHVYGLRQLMNGRIVTIPRSLLSANMVDVHTGMPLPAPPRCDGLLPTADGALLGQEVVWGQGIIRVQLP